MSKKFKYVGQEPQHLAQVGFIQPNQVITVDDKIASALEENDPQNYVPYVEPQAEPDAKVGKTPSTKAPAKAPAQVAEAPAAAAPGATATPAAVTA